MITGFVFVMMLIIEYINVQTKGIWHDNLAKSHWKQYFLAAFMGAIPFLTLASMYNDNKVVKYLSYAASFAAAWSRVNDDDHYLSQAALGWYLAFESVDAVFDADKKKRNISIIPMIGRDSYGVSVQMKW